MWRFALRAWLQRDTELEVTSKGDEDLDLMKREGRKLVWVCSESFQQCLELHIVCAMESDERGPYQGSSLRRLATSRHKTRVLDIILPGYTGF